MAYFERYHKSQFKFSNSDNQSEGCDINATRLETILLLKKK